MTFLFVVDSQAKWGINYMEFIQNENRDYTTFIEKTEYPLDLLAQIDLEPTILYEFLKSEPKSLDYESMYVCEQDSVHSGINLEQPIYNVISSMHLLVEHKNDFRNVYAYCGQRGIDLISIDKQGKKWLIEATNPKYTTSLGIEAWLEKIIRFLKIDPEHKHIWAIVISHVNAKTVPFKIKCLMYKLKIRLIDLKLTATSHNDEYVMGALRSKLNSGYDYFSANPK